MANAAGVLVLLVVVLDLLVFSDVTVLFDVAFVLVCVAAALAVRPQDFFVIGVLPPLLMAGTVAVLALLDPQLGRRPGRRLPAGGRVRAGPPRRVAWSSATR